MSHISEQEPAERLELQAGRRAPFTMNPDWVLLAPISNGAKTLYWTLNAHVNQQRASRGDTEVWPTRDQLALFLGFSRRQSVTPLINELLAINAIDVRQVRTHGGLRPRTVFAVHQTPPDGWTGPTSLQAFHTGLKDLFPQVAPNVRSTAPSNVRWTAPSNVRSTAQELDEPQPDEPQPDSTSLRSVEKEVPSVRPSVAYVMRASAPEARQAAQSTPVAEVVRQEADGRTDGTSSEKKTHHPEAVRSDGAAGNGGNEYVDQPKRPVEPRTGLLATVDVLLAEPAVTAALSRLGCRVSQRTRLAAHVAAALGQGHTVDQIRGYVLVKARESTSRRMSYLLRAFSPEHIGDLSDVTPVPRTNTQTTRSTRQEQARTAPQQPRQALSTPSPVPWVTDTQYAALKLSERAALATYGRQPEDTLTDYVRSIFGRIRHQLVTAATAATTASPTV